MSSQKPGQEHHHPLPFWIRWFILLIVCGVVIGLAVLWVIQGVNAFFPIVIITVLGIIFGFLQLYFQLLPPSLLLPKGKNRSLSIQRPLNQLRGSETMHSSGLFLSEGQSKELTGPPASVFPRVNWGEAPQLGRFYGREQEITELRHWIIDERCRVVSLLGMGGIGKTILAVMLTEQVKASFDHVFWRSLQNAPSLKEVLQDCIQFISDQQRTELPENIDSQISLLIQYLREQHCLLVLDNVESILQGGKRAGYYREGYEEYANLFQRMGETSHQSCLLLTSREKLKEVAILEGKASPVRSLRLEGLKSSDGQEILKDKALQGTTDAWVALVKRYGGNPLALKLVSQFIREVFDGNIASFLKDETVVFNDVRDILEQQFERLSALEGVLMYWLAIERETVTLDDLERSVIRPVTAREIQETLLSLGRRSFIEKNNAGITLQNVVMEYVTDRFVGCVVEEISNETLALFGNYCLMKAQAKDYVRESQNRLILMPIIQHLQKSFGGEGTERKLKHILSLLRNVHAYMPDYSAGNILNMLVQLGCDLRGCDFSHLVVWQAYLQGAVLPEVNFTRSDLKTSVFTDTFDCVRSVAFSLDGKMMAAGTTSSEIWIWQTTDDTLLQTFNVYGGWVRSVSFSLDANVVASGSDDKTVRIWEVNTGKCLQTLQGHTNQVTSVAFSPDGSTIVSGSHDKTVRIWEVSTGKCLQTLQGHTHRVKSVVFSLAGDIVASGSDDKTVRIWEVSTGKCFHILQGHTQAVKSIVFSPTGGMIASGSDDKTVRIWEVSTGKCLHTLVGHIGRVQTVAFSPDGKVVASGSHDHIVRLWEASTGRHLYALQGHAQWIWSVAFSPDGNTIASGGDDQNIRLWEVNTGRCIRTLQGYTGRVQSVAFSRDSKIAVSGGDDQLVRIWEVNTGRCIRILQGHTQWVWSVAFSPDGTFVVSSSGDRTVRMWEVSNGRCIHILRGHDRWVRSVTFSPDGTLIASGSGDNTVRLWNTATGDCLHTLQGHMGSLKSLSFNVDGQILASGGDDGTVRLWEVNTGDHLSTWQVQTDQVNAISFSPAGDMFVSGGSDRIIRLWEASTGNSLCILQGHTSSINSIAFSSDGKYLISGSDDQTVRLWEISTSNCLYILRGHTNRVSSVAFSSEGTMVMSGSDDETIKFWDVRTGTCLKTVRGERPYEGMNITSTSGLTETQKRALKRLGAINNKDING